MSKGISKQQKEILVRLASLGQPQCATDLASIFYPPHFDGSPLGREARVVAARHTKRALRSLERRGLVTVFAHRDAPTQDLLPAKVAAVLTSRGMAIALS